MDSDQKQKFSDIVAPHFDALYRAAFRLTQSRFDAEDLVQDVCAKACANLTELGSANEPRAWLMRVQYRLFIEARRRWLRSPISHLRIDTESADAACADQPGVEDYVDGLASQSAISDAWQRLDRNQRALLGLHAEGYSLTELEPITGASKNALSGRLHRARIRLAKLLRASALVSLPIRRQEH